MSKASVEEGLTITKRSLKQIELEIKSAYQETLAIIRNELLKLNDQVNELSQGELIKYSRLQKLQDKIQEEIDNLNKNIAPMIEKQRKKTAEVGFDINSLGLIFMALLNKKSIKISLDYPISGQTFKQTIKGFTVDSVKKLNSIITQSIAQGKGIKDISKQITEAMNISYKRAITIARTETLRALSIGQLEATNKLIQQGYKVRKVWQYSYEIPLSRQNHIEMDGKEADKDGWFNFPDGIRMQAPHTSGVASHDINCRCRYYNEIVEE